MRWAMSVSTRCSIRSCLRPSVKQAAACRDRPMARSVSRNNKAPAFDVMAPPSNAAVTFRPPRLAKSRESWLHSVGIGVVSCVRKILFGRRTFADSARRCPYLCEICGLVARTGVRREVLLEFAGFVLVFAGVLGVRLFHGDIRPLLRIFAVE